MDILFRILLIAAVIAGAVLYFKWKSAEKKVAEARDAAARAKAEADNALDALQRRQATIVARLNAEMTELSLYTEIRDVGRVAEQLREASDKAYGEAQREVERILAEANRAADELRKNANTDAKAKREQIEQVLASATRQAQQVIQDANKRAEDIAGSAYTAMKDAERIKEVATAMENVIEGYGDRYLKPTYSLLDELADAYGFEEAGQQLKLARDRSKLMVERKQAATCDYVEASRRETAIHFVADAFNGKVDSILSRVKSDNFGTLEQQIKDAFALVNHNGRAFRNATITPQYLTARLDELRWAVAVSALREKAREEQRQIRERIREEEKARREIERALKEAAREEEVLQRAMEKVQAQAAKANEAQRAEFDAKLNELRNKLIEAEARSQRALSMAQQTKAGHVYVISNIGSFGEEVFKIGMTRRLEPVDRVRELGDASVPFAFDVHALIWSEDAPRLENDLHKHFMRSQVNKVNPRKEFFRLSLSDIRSHVEHLGVEVSWTTAAAAAEYRETLAIEKRLNENPAAAKDWERHQVEVVNTLERTIDLEVEAT